MSNEGKSANILLIQPGYGHYRDGLFKTLAESHDIIVAYERSHNVYPSSFKLNELPHFFLDRNYFNTKLGLISYMIKRRPSLVISSVSFSFRSVVSFLYSICFKKRFILWIEEWRKHNPSSQFFRNVYRYLKNKISAILIRHCDALIVVGTAAKKYAQSLGKKESDIFLAAQSTTDISEQRQDQKFNLSKASGKLVFLYLGRIIEGKGLDILIKAFSLLCKHRTDVFLLIAGGGPFRSYCDKLVQELRLEHAVTFIGSVPHDNVASVYRLADVFVLPSYSKGILHEGWGIVVNEAISMSLPVIVSTAVGAAYDLVVNGYNGLIVKENSVRELSFAMEKILDMDLLQLSKNSRTMFQNRNDYCRMSHGFLSAIEYAKSK